MRAHGLYDAARIPSEPRRSGTPPPRVACSNMRTRVCSSPLRRASWIARYVSGPKFTPTPSVVPTVSRLLGAPRKTAAGDRSPARSRGRWRARPASTCTAQGHRSRWTRGAQGRRGRGCRRSDDAARRRTVVGGYTWHGSGGSVVGHVQCVSTNSATRCEKHEMRFDTSYTSGATTTNRRSLACHENGHTIGLAHRTDSTSCMEPALNGVTAYSSHDVAHINANY